MGGEGPPAAAAVAESRDLLAAAQRGSTGTLLRQVHSRFTAEAEPGGGPRPRDVVVLGALAGQDAASQQDLADRLSVNRTIMVKLIDRLQEAGYVTRTRNPANRRTYVLSLTGPGADALTGMRADAARRQERITAALAPAERHRLDELLSALLPESERPAVASTEHLVTQAHYRFRRLGDQALAAQGLGGSGLRTRHFGVLPALDLLGPCPQQQLARELGFTEATTAQLVDELVQAGLVTRGQDPHDRRRYALELTDAGRQRIPPMLAALRQVEAGVRDLLGPAAAQELHGLLTRLLDAPGNPAGGCH
ncbi:MAG TPA: MarR family transcriptional regulator [Streptosporangiaceae bacterium]|nr:MarR family transcriptional regulator [Streptosporangiaceae bacterium]